jgi:hypothetical protein
MSSRAHAARRLAEHLSTATATPVTACWDNPTGRPAHGAWRIQWADGPTVTTMRALATAHARLTTPLDLATVRFTRHHTSLTWAVVLLAHARAATLPATATAALALVEYDLADTDTTTLTPADRAAATDLTRRGHHDPKQMATLLLSRVTKPHHQTPPPTTVARPACPHCGRHLPAAAATGRPARWCSPTCRQAAHRQRTATVTKPRTETTCPVCGQPIHTAATGRPARWCSPTCRTRAWRTRHP